MHEPPRDDEPRQRWADRRLHHGAVIYRVPITEADFDRLLKGHQAMILNLLRYPPSLSIALVPAGEARLLPTDYQVHQVPLLVGPEAQGG